MMLFLSSLKDNRAVWYKCLVSFGYQDFGDLTLKMCVTLTLPSLLCNGDFTKIKKKIDQLIDGELMNEKED